MCKFLLVFLFFTSFSLLAQDAVISVQVNKEAKEKRASLDVNSSDVPVVNPLKPNVEVEKASSQLAPVHTLPSVYVDENRSIFDLIKFSNFLEENNNELVFKAKSGDLLDNIKTLLSHSRIKKVISKIGKHNVPVDFDVKGKSVSDILATLNKSQRRVSKKYPSGDFVKCVFYDDGTAILVYQSELSKYVL
jgi:hypothetical protein